MRLFAQLRGGKSKGRSWKGEEIQSGPQRNFIDHATPVAQSLLLHPQQMLKPGLKIGKKQKKSVWKLEPHSTVCTCSVHISGDWKIYGHSFASLGSK